MDQSQEKLDESLRSKSRVVFILRFLVALACAAALAFFEGGDIFSSPGYRSAYVLLLCACILDLAYILPLWMLGLRKIQAGIHIAFDVVIITALVYLTGGAQSVFTLLYFAPIICASYMLPAVPSAIFPASAAGGLFTVALAFHFSAQGAEFPMIPPDIAEEFIKGHEKLPPLLGDLFLRATAFLAVFVLGTRLLGKADRERIVIEEIIESMGEGIITVDSSGRIALLNRSARAVLDLPPDLDAAGKPLGDVMKTPALADLAERLRLGKEGRLEASLKFKNRRATSVSISTWPVKDEKGRFRGTVAIVKDLTLEKEIEEVRKTADKLKGIREMAAGIAHEIRNPLTSIRGSIQELASGSAASEQDVKLMNIILKESDRLNHIITEFLDLTTKRMISVKPANLAEIIDDVVVLLSKRAEKGEAKIRVEASGDLTARVDVEQMRQVFFNLGLNALQAMCGKGLLLIKAHPQESYAAVDAGTLERARVSGISAAFLDTGPGIDSETLPKIFTPFFSTKPKGTGIGLSLVQRSVDAHGGSLSVDTTPGTGTTFTVWIPKNIEEAPR